MACYIERAWSRRALLTTYNATDEMKSTVQIAGGLQVYRNNAFARGFLARYLTCAERYAADPPPTEAQAAGFSAHRHDQSCLSLLSKLDGVKSYPWPVPTHDFADVWWWEAGFCEESFAFPLSGESQVGRQGGSRETSTALCRQAQGVSRTPPLTDYLLSPR